MEISESPPKTAGELIDLTKLKIVGHALDDFTLRAGILPMTEAFGEIRRRLAASAKIVTHSSIKLKPQKGTSFFLDVTDPALVYVVKQNKNGNGTYLAAVLRPLRAGPVKFGH